ncbi:MAG TPA: hypothetical protein VN260_09750, partial [Dissulfurispiraceae bacterium]|nr:hypothetical protein [Dissulfurispiraceae bacterium]
MRRTNILSLLSIIILAISFGLFGCGGGGGGSTDVPKGENPGIPTIIQVQPTHFVAQTNSTLFVNAKVLDGNGIPIANTPVVFTNLSLTGGTPSTVRSVTDTEGVARTSITSSTPGFATIQAEIASGSGNVRDSKTVFFSPFSRNFPGPTLRIDIDGDADGVFNEPNDFIIFENPSDRQILVRATVLDPFGQPIAGDLVRFGADSTEAVFPIALGDSAATDANGQANILMEFSPQALRPFAMTINIFAVGDFSGAANLVSVFVQPITVRSVVVSANPNPVESGQEVTISAVVTTSAGTFVPDGTAVNFSSTDGGIEPFAQTVNGVASVQYTAPSLDA